MSERKVYFGAANGYTGFRSNFAAIFSPHTIDKLFIIKGGPGTGKSTLMRRIDEYYSERFDTTVILCSSDPESYDGVIIEKDEKAIALVDGTPPHVMEPMYPGAVEEIVNLGDSFDYEALRSRKNEIASLSDKKKSAYKRAYNTLGIAGHIHDYISNTLSDFCTYSSAEMLFNEALQAQTNGATVCEKSPFLIGSFSKNGYRSVGQLYHQKAEIKIGGDGISEYILLSELKKMLDKKKVCYSLFASPFSTDIPDMIKVQDTVFIKSDSVDFNVNSTDLISLNEEYFRVYKSYQYMLESSRRSLEKASEYHFALESIYSNAVRFWDNEKQYDHIVASIDRILDK